MPALKCLRCGFGSFWVRCYPECLGFFFFFFFFSSFFFFFFLFFFFTNEAVPGQAQPCLFYQGIPLPRSLPTCKPVTSVSVRVGAILGEATDPIHIFAHQGGSLAPLSCHGVMFRFLFRGAPFSWANMEPLRVPSPILGFSPPKQHLVWLTCSKLSFSSRVPRCPSSKD